MSRPTTTSRTPAATTRRYRGAAAIALSPIEEALKLGVAALWIALMLLGLWSLVANPRGRNVADFHAAPSYPTAIATFTGDLYPNR